MFVNLERHGIGAQRKLYKAPGQRVIDTYALLMGRDLPDGAIIAAMADTIREVGPEKVSGHCADPKRLQVVDVAPSSIARHEPFGRAVMQEIAAGVVSKFLRPPTDPAFHLEIPEPEVVA